MRCHGICANIMTENLQEKTALRRALLANRQAIAAEVRNRWDAAISRRVLAWWDANPVRVLGIYWPIRGEPDLRTVYAELAMRGAQLALPTILAKDAPLGFLAWQPGDAMVEDAFGVAIPATRDELRPDALLIPCVGFNDRCIRLGYGGGFYDRTLAVTPRARAVGVGYACGFAAFDAAPHDIALDAIITETSLIAAARRG
jgi:5,10-methenyltetrahydrofolate synthetase